MTTTFSWWTVARWRMISGFAPALVLAMAMLAVSGSPASAAGIPRSISARTPSSRGSWLDQGSWLKRPAIFLLTSFIGGFIFYKGLFPALLRKNNATWPMDAWRLASYGTWISICASTYIFKRPLVERVIRPLLAGGPSALIEFFMEIVLLPLMVIVGALVIFNFRRESTNRVRPS